MAAQLWMNSRRARGRCMMPGASWQLGATPAERTKCTNHQKVTGRVILYEYPCNERVRALLRVEHLFGRLFFFAQGEDVHYHQVAVVTLFDLLDIADRTDLRGAVLQDLERQRVALSGLRQHPGVDASMLDQMLEEIQ